MSVRRRGRTVFLVAFAVLLLDGAAAVWLGQVSGRGVLVGVGLVLVAAALGVALLYRRWQAALDDVERAQREVHREIDALRRVVSDTRGGRPPSP
jgi:UPF0716 family protein affecting phage T7 exclusion